MKQAGFTIIELLMVIAIITILPVVVLSNFPQVKLQFALSRSAHAFAQNVRKVQDLALSSTPYKDSFNIVRPVGGYGIYVDINNLGNKKYIIYADALPANGQYDVADYVVVAVDLAASEPGGAIVGLNHVFLNKASINFSVPNAAASITQLDKNNTAVEIIFALEKDPAKTKSVFVSTAGLVEIQN